MILLSHATTQKPNNELIWFFDGKIIALYIRQGIFWQGNLYLYLYLLIFRYIYIHLALGSWHYWCHYYNNVWDFLHFNQHLNSFVQRQFHYLYTILLRNSRNFYQTLKFIAKTSFVNRFMVFLNMKFARYSASANDSYYEETQETLKVKQLG